MMYQWLTAEQIEWLVNPALQSRKMAILNTDCCRVLGGWEGDRLISFLTIQLFPILGPLIRLDETYRDNGEVSRELTQRMHSYLDGADARGFLVVAESPITSRLCERHGMRKVESPIYAADGRGVECNNYTSEAIN